MLNRERPLSEVHEGMPSEKKRVKKVMTSGPG